MSYNKPSAFNMPFRFTSGGYVPSDPANIKFTFGSPLYQQTADLQAAIVVLALDHDVKDLSVYVKPTISAYEDFGSYIKSTTTSYKNLLTYIYGIPPKDLPSYIHGWDIKNLSAYAYSIPPKDLQVIINIIEIRNLSVTITGEWWHDYYDVSARLNIFQRECLNLGIYIRSYMMPFDLPAYLNVIDYGDLSAYLNVFYREYKDLGAYIKRIYASDLSAYLIGKKGFAVEKNLPIYLIGGYGPGDIQAYIYAIPPKNLSAYISGFKGIAIPFNLRAAIESYYKEDLQASIYPINPFDLGVYINSIGKSVILGASIIPRTIRFKRAINIALLEHKDLKALINFMCFNSEYKNLLAYIKAIYKLDLRGIIFGWIGFNISNLKCYINTAIYDVEDDVYIRLIPSSSTNNYAIVKLRFGVTDKYTVFDTLQILYGSYYALDLSASIYGMFRSVDLSASLTPIFDYNYTELPPWINPKTHEAVINLERFETQWQRFIELMFETYGDDNFHYFYVSGSNKVYRIDKNRHWTIWAKSYRQDKENMIERVDVRHKYIFKMSNYNNIDEAVRDLIDRVSAYRKIDLGMYIDGKLPSHLNLNAHIIPNVKHRWQKHLYASLVGRLRGYQATETESLDVSINGV